MACTFVFNLLLNARKGSVLAENCAPVDRKSYLRRHGGALKNRHNTAMEIDRATKKSEEHDPMEILYSLACILSG
jgi:hypothetical protein